MELYIPFLIFGLYIIIAGVLIINSIKREKKRGEQLQLLAQQFKLGYQKDDTNRILKVVKKFKMLSIGRKHKIYNILLKESNDITILLFDFKYTTGSGKNSSTQYRSIAYVKSKHFELPYFSIGPENFFHTIGKFFGYKDINFEMYPEFSKKYLLKGEDELSIERIFNRKIINFFLKKSKFSMEADRQEFVMTQGYRRKKIDEIEGFLREVIEVGQLFLEQSGDRY